MADKPLTAEEQAWANENAEAVRLLMRNNKNSQSRAVVSNDPLQAAALSLLNSMKQLSSQIIGTIERKRTSP